MQGVSDTKNSQIWKRAYMRTFIPKKVCNSPITAHQPINKIGRESSTDVYGR